MCYLKYNIAERYLCSAYTNANWKLILKPLYQGRKSLARQNTRASRIINAIVNKCS